MSFAGKWVELESIMLREISQTQIPCFHSYTESRLIIIIGICEGHGKETTFMTMPIWGARFLL